MKKETKQPVLLNEKRQQVLDKFEKALTNISEFDLGQIYMMCQMATGGVEKCQQ